MHGALHGEVVVNQLMTVLFVELLVVLARVFGHFRAKYKVKDKNCYTVRRLHGVR
jgi:hypothetical protein